MKLVTLLTDFGLRDAYVAQVKGTILGRCPDCTIVDLSHLVGRHNIAEGAFLLESSVQHFPKNTIHVGIVDPGVGSTRLPIIIECKSAALVGPDNGLLSMAAERLGIDQAYRISESKLHVGKVSSTFHGRDIFAVAAAELARGKQARSIGTSVRSITRLKVSKPIVTGNKIRCVVLHVDAFGNVITNAGVGLADILIRGRTLVVEARFKSLKAKWSDTYSDAGKRELLVLKGSQGYLEVAVREDSASERLGLNVGDELVIGSG